MKTLSMMQWTLLALIPGTLAYACIFGVGILINILVVCGTAVATEAMVMHLRGQSVRLLLDGTALVAAWLLALCLPPLLPVWQAMVGIGLGLVFGKHVYGGLGKNLFNPAMVGFAILIVSFPLSMSEWPAINDHQTIAEVLAAKTRSDKADAAYDGMSRATPLDAYKFRAGLTNAEFFSPSAEINWHAWLTINLAFLLGGMILLYRKIISWQAPAGFLLALSLLAMLFYDSGSSMSLGSPVFHVFSGATMLAAFFIITDPVTSPMHKELLLLYGALIGAITFLIRVTGAYPEGVAFAVLLTNACTPLMDHLASLRESTS